MEATNYGNWASCPVLDNLVHFYIIFKIIKNKQGIYVMSTNNIDQNLCTNYIPQITLGIKYFVYTWGQI